MPKKSGQVPTLSELIRTTAPLHRDLTNLMKRHPEDHLDLGDRIFVRLLNPMWRNPFGKEYTPEQRKQSEAVEWIERYQNYIRELEGLICAVMGEPEVFKTLPLHELPIFPWAQISAAECLRRLDLQEAASSDWRDAISSSLQMRKRNSRI
jgi:hypothetical protein